MWEYQRIPPTAEPVRNQYDTCESTPLSDVERARIISGYGAGSFYCCYLDSLKEVHPDSPNSIGEWQAWDRPYLYFLLVLCCTCKPDGCFEQHTSRKVLYNGRIMSRKEALIAYQRDDQHHDGKWSKVIAETRRTNDAKVAEILNDLN